MADAILLSPRVNNDDLNTDDFGNASETLSYKVPGVPPSFIDKNGGVFGLPARFSDHPLRPGQGLIARDIRIADYGNGRDSLVEVLFSTSRSGLVDLRNGAFAWSMTREQVEEVIPIQVLTRSTFSTRDPSGDVVPTTVATWGPPARPKTLRQRRTVIQGRWEIENPDGNTIQAFANQDNKVHLLNGSYYLFQVGTMQPKQARQGDPRKRYLFVGQWTQDLGTADAVSSNTESLAYPADIVNVFGFPYLGIPKLPGLMRAPWHYIQLAPTPPNYGGGVHPGSPKSPFLIEQQPEYLFDDTGYTQLPGIPSEFPSGVL